MDTYKVMTWTVKQISALGRIQIEENSGNDNDLFLQAGIEKFEAIRDG
jgi:hypothetical protein